MTRHGCVPIKLFTKTGSRWDLAYGPQFANQCSRYSIFSPDLTEAAFTFLVIYLQNLNPFLSPSEHSPPTSPIELNEGQVAQKAEHQARGERAKKRGSKRAEIWRGQGGSSTCRVKN